MDTAIIVALISSLASTPVSVVSLASDLGNRLDNIRNLGFLAYLDVEGHRRETAILSTQFRFARYFECLERLHSRHSVSCASSAMRTPARWPRCSR